MNARAESPGGFPIYQFDPHAVGQLKSNWENSSGWRSVKDSKVKGSSLAFTMKRESLPFFPQRWYF